MNYELLRELDIDVWLSKNQLFQPYSGYYTVGSQLTVMVSDFVFEYDATLKGMLSVLELPQAQQQVILAAEPFNLALAQDLFRSPYMLLLVRDVANYVNLPNNCFVTFNPAYLSQNPNSKRLAFNTLKKLQKELCLKL